MKSLRIFIHTILLLTLVTTLCWAQAPSTSALQAHERATLDAHVGWIAGMAFSPDGKTLIIGGDANAATANGITGMLKLFDPATGKELPSLTGHTAQVLQLGLTSD